jgi:glycosyltransferase involved in cell wall biosynthesis
MRIGLDGIPLATPRTGVGHYTFELARHLALAASDHKFQLVSPFAFDPPIADEELPSNLKAIRPQVGAWRRRWFAVGLPLYLRQAAIDLFHGTNYDVPLWSKCPSVLTIHDLSLLLYGSTHEGRLARRGRYRLPIMARRAAAIITPSEAVKREVSQYLKIKPSKLFVVPEAARSFFRPVTPEESEKVRRRFKIEGDFILCVGTIEPRKNLITLLQAFEEVVRHTQLKPQLVVAGKVGWLTDKLFSRADQSDAADRLVFTGYLGDDELRALYSAASVFVYPSIYEGFGLPVLEAMACGAPVITSDIPSLNETAGNAARLVSPNDAQALAKNVVDLLENKSEQQYLSQAGIKHSQQFSWEKTARATLDVYSEVVTRTSKNLASRQL